MPGRVQQLVRGFAADWKRSIESINQEIMRSFSNFKNGTAILQVSKEFLPSATHQKGSFYRQCRPARVFVKGLIMQLVDQQ